MKQFLKLSLATYAFIFVALYVGSQIYIFLGPTKAMIEKQDDQGNGYIEWSKTGPDVIPRNLTEAFEDILKETPKERIDAYRSYLQALPDDWNGFDKFRYELEKSIEGESEDHQMHFGMGTRNTWGLWFKSRLARWMVWHGASSHPEDMTISIRESFDDYIEHGIKPTRWKGRFMVLTIYSTLIFIPFVLIYLLYKLFKNWSNKTVLTTLKAAPPTS